MDVWKMIVEERRTQEKEEQHLESYIHKENGLKYCIHCHRPLEKEVELFGEKKKISILCDCQKERQEQAQKEEEEWRRQQLIRCLTEECFDESIYQQWNFHTMDEDTEHKDFAKQYVKKFDKVLEHNLGILMTGDVGCGKTYLAVAIANALLEKTIPVRMTNFSVLLNDMASFETHKQKYMNRLNQKKLLIFDDFGMERHTSFAEEMIFQMIDSRYRSGKPLIITTNLNLSSFTNPNSTKEKRIYSRILEMCSPLIFTGENRRLKQMKEKARQVRELLT